jgi:hypothetical protein
MVLSPAELRPEGYCAGETKQQQYITDPSGRHKITNPQLSKEKEKLVTGPNCGLIPGQTGKLTVGRKISLTLSGGQMKKCYELLSLQN